MLKLIRQKNFLVKNKWNPTRHFSDTAKRDKTRLMFLGTPECAANSLKSLIDNESKYNYEVVAVTTQPACPINGMTDVAKMAKKLSIVCYTPAKPNDIDYLNDIENVVKPDICLTVAYGGFLPSRFLKIPRYGVYNLHPSLLPRYRGAAPLQRCLENGDKTTGITLLQTVLKMDAGDIVEQVPVELKGYEKANELLVQLFDIGLQLFFKNFNAIVNNSIYSVLTPQCGDNSTVTYASKIHANDCIVDFKTMSGIDIYNKYRGFYDKPGVKFTCYYYQHQNKASDQREKKVINVKVTGMFLLDINVMNSMSMDVDRFPCNQLVYIKPSKKGTNPYIDIENNIIREPFYMVKCVDNRLIGVSELQPDTKKNMLSQDFHNGIRKQALFYE